MKKEEKYFNDGLVAYSNKNYDNAIYYFSELIDKFSNLIDNTKLSEIYYMRGICHAQEYSIDEALKDFSEAEKLGFDKSKIYCGRGIAYAHNGENDKAIANFNKAIKLNNVYEEAYCRKGISYTFMEKPGRAITYFSKTIELNKFYYKAYHYRGFVFYQKKEYDKAIEDFNKAIELDNKSILDYNYRGLVYYKLKEYDKAIEDFDKAIELDNEFALAYNNRGMVYLNNNEYDKAIEDFNKAIKNFNKAIEFALAFAYSNRGLAYFNKNKYDKDIENFNKAIEDFNKAIELDNEFALAYNNRGMAYINNEYDKAIEDFNKTIELDNKFAPAYYNRGLAYLNKNEYDKAIEDFNKAIKLDDKIIQVYNYRGLAYFHKGEYDKAFENFKKFKPNDTLNYMVKIFLINEEGVNNIEKLPIKYADSYFTSVIGKNIKINKNKLFKIWCYQYILLDLLSIKNYQNIKEFSHYTSKNTFEKLISNDEENYNAYLRFTSISKANDPKEGEILKNLLSINTEKNIDIKEQNKDYLVLQTSFIRYTNSLTMFRLYGKDKEREGTGISLVFNNSFFDINELTTTSPAQSLGNLNYDYKKENQIKNKNYKKLQLPYSKVYTQIEPKYELLPLHFMLYYDKDRNELIYNPTDSIYENKRIKLDELNNINFSYGNNIDDIANNIGFIFKKIFNIINELKSDKELEITYKLLINIRYLIKHSAFFEEQELRLIKLTKNDDDVVLLDKDINRLYSDYKIPIFEEDFLKKIIIGPKVENATSVKEVYQHLIMKNKSNKNIDIEISDLPLN